MFERFTERARQVIVLAQDEARTLKHNYIGTEHILLGLLREEEGLAARVLDTLDITVEEVRAEVIRIVGQGDEVATGQIAFTLRTQHMFRLALRAALDLGYTDIHTEHLLLGLVSETDGLGAQILLASDADAETIRNEIVRMLSGPSNPHHAPTGTARFVIQSDRRYAPSVAGRPYPESGSLRLLVACPACTTPIESVTTDQGNANFQASMQGNHICPECERCWAITATAGWTDPVGSKGDIPSEISVWHYSDPWHLGLACQRCDYFLERVTLDATTESSFHVEDDITGPCPVCGKQWRISYSVSWEEQSGRSPP